MGLYIDDKPVTKKQACEILGIDFNSIPQHRRKVVEMKTRVIDDKGTKRSAKSYGGKPEYSVYVKSLQQEVKIRYAISQKKIKDNLNAYAPKTLWLLPAEDGTILITDEAQFLFWYLSPACLHSPFHDPQQNYHYEYQDKNKEAETDMEREENIINAMSILLGANSWSDQQLKHLAKGMNIGGVDDMTPAVVKSHLKKLAYKDPVKFYNQATSREVLFTGKIQQAIDDKILVLKSLNGMQRWFLKEDEILPVQFGQDPLTELKQHMAEKWYLYSEKVENALKGVTLLSMLNNPQNDEAFKEAPIEKPTKIKAQLTDEQRNLLKEMKQKEWMEEKMQKIAGYNIDDPNLHPAQRKSYEDNKHYFEAWKLAKELEEEPVV